MKKTQKDKLKRILSSYFKEIHRIYVAGDFRKASQRKCGNIILELIR
ncbi:MAG: hypothetical protein GH152_04030 [Dehalococcoidia bacterium]|nr:hypothetical protein [Dehalococcoidia bacterium]